MKRVFVYSKSTKPIVVVGKCEVALKGFNCCWDYFETDSNEFLVKFVESETKLNIEGKGEFAFYINKVLRLKTCSQKVLLVVDSPIYIYTMDNHEYNEIYENWIQFWIEHYLFNGSKIVYNIDDYCENFQLYKDTVYEPDMIISERGQKVFSYESRQILNLLENFEKFYLIREDLWDSRNLLERIEGKFEFIKNLRLCDDKVVFEIQENDEGNIEDIKKFVKSCDLKSKLLINKTSPEKLIIEVFSAPKAKLASVQFCQQFLGFSNQETFLSITKLCNYSTAKLPVYKIFPNTICDQILSLSKPEKFQLLINSHYSFPQSIQFHLNSLPSSQYSVFIYSQKSPQQVIINSESVQLTLFKSKWLTFKTTSSMFYIQTNESKVKYKLPKPGRYAIYRNKLIKIEHNLNKLLFVTDLDNTIFNKSSQGVKYYRMFIEYWIAFFEFNGSVLAYNTGRDLKGFLVDEKKLFFADLHFFCLGTYAYVLDEQLNLVQDPNFPSFFQSLQTHDWDSQILADALISTFNLPQECLRAVYPSYFLLKISSEEASQYWENIKCLIQNKENSEFGSRVLCGKAKLLTFKSENLRLVEIVPKYAGKNVGVLYSQQKFAFNTGQTVTAGDSLNDTDMLKIGGLGIIMLNSEQLLYEWANKKPRKNLVVSTEPYGFGLLKEFQKLVRVLT